MTLHSLADRKFTAHVTPFPSSCVADLRILVLASAIAVIRPALGPGALESRLQNTDLPLWPGLLIRGGVQSKKGKPSSLELLWSLEARKA